VLRWWLEKRIVMVALPTLSATIETPASRAAARALVSTRGWRGAITVTPLMPS
jgi:hypothetical protein